MQWSHFLFASSVHSNHSLHPHIDHGMSFAGSSGLVTRRFQRGQSATDCSFRHTKCPCLVAFSTLRAPHVFHPLLDELIANLLCMPHSGRLSISKMQRNVLQNWRSVSNGCSYFKPGVSSLSCCALLRATRKRNVLQIQKKL